MALGMSKSLFRPAPAGACRRMRPSKRGWAVLCSLITVALAAATLPRPAVADVLDIRKADNALTLDAGASYLDYAETYAGTTLDTEKGWLPTVGLSFGMLAFPQAPIANLYLHLDARASLGSTYYNGGLCDQFGNCIPYQSNTNDQIFTGAAQIGRAFALGRVVMLTPYAEIGYRYWSRELTGTGGYTEDYHNWDAMGGLLAQWSPVARWVLSLSGAAGKTFGADMSTSGITGANENFALGSEITWRVQAKAGFRITERVELTSTAEYSTLSYGASAVDANGYYEPDSTTHQTTLLLGIAWHFF
jgi:hypothetical protein